LILDCRDITQRKKDGEELSRAQKAKEQFLANISHEIRTPINGIAGMAGLLSQNPTHEEQKTYLNAIKSAADNLKVIINDILDLASIESGRCN
jgi:signal transduction histidine kinase